MLLLIKVFLYVTRQFVILKVELDELQGAQLVRQDGDGVVAQVERLQVDQAVDLERYGLQQVVRNGELAQCVGHAAREHTVVQLGYVVVVEPERANAAQRVVGKVVDLGVREVERAERLELEHDRGHVLALYLALADQALHVGVEDAREAHAIAYVQRLQLLALLERLGQAVHVVGHEHELAERGAEADLVGQHGQRTLRQVEIAQLLQVAHVGHQQHDLVTAQIEHLERGEEPHDARYAAQIALAQAQVLEVLQHAHLERQTRQVVDVLDSQRIAAYVQVLQVH